MYNTVTIFDAHQYYSCEYYLLLIEPYVYITELFLIYLGIIIMADHHCYTLV